MSKLREIQYKTSERNAVEHFWVCVYRRRQWLRDDFHWYYHNVIPFNYEITLHSHLFCDWPPYGLMVTISVITAVTHLVIPCSNARLKAFASTEFNEIFFGLPVASGCEGFQTFRVITPSPSLGCAGSFVAPKLICLALPNHQLIHVWNLSW